jgi:UDP-N-acetylmuramoylalanine--D-glutamate ligase
MKLDEVVASRVAVWGLGVEGAALVRLLQARGCTPVLVDDHPVEARLRLAEAGRSEMFGGGGEVHDPDSIVWGDLDVVVRSPGVSRYRREFEVAGDAGVVVTTAMAIWLEDMAGENVLAVTGSKGKSTTATMTAALLREEGFAVELVGNIGTPVTDTYDRPPAGFHVVEVSSYQAADVTHSPRAVVLTGLGADHLDWHGGVENYYRDKLRLVSAGPEPMLAVSAASPEALARTSHVHDRILFGPDGRVVLREDGMIAVDSEVVIDADRLRVPGRHNVWNLCGAISGFLLAVGRAPGRGSLEAMVANFSGLPSRCAVVGEFAGRTFVDDALASNPLATVTSLEAFAGRPVAVIVGGADRGVDLFPLVEALSARDEPTSVVVLPPEPHRWTAALATALAPDSLVVADDLDGAVGNAFSLAGEGGVVLFSPAAPTPEGGGGYQARSARFIAAAKAVG